MVVSTRIKTIGDFIKPGEIVVDVGADHGELEILLSPKVDHIKAIENKSGPYSILKEAVKDLKNVEALYSDGLDDIDELIDTIVVAGMGGHLINDILKKNFHRLNNITQIVVDPHRDIYEVRKYLTSNGFMIEKEIIVKENTIYYFIISFVKGSQTLTEDELEFGYKTNHDPLWGEYKQFEKTRLEDLFIKSHSNEILERLRRLEIHEHD